MAERTLYSMPSSGNSFKVRLLLAHLGLPYRHVALENGSADLAKAKAEGVLPLGKVPLLVLEDGTALPESNAILCFLAEGTAWMPQDPVARAKVLGWMFWEQNAHEGVIAVRAALQTYEDRKALATPERMAELLNRGHDLLGVMEHQLSAQDWIATDAPSVADIALYGYTHSAGPKGGFEMARFPAVMRWIDRMAALPGHVGLADIPA